MKLFTLAMSLFLISLSAFATVIVGVDYANDDPSDIEVSRRMGETGFYRHDLVCFTGKPDGACKLIEKEARESLNTYSRGAHGYFKVQTCVIEQNEVNLSYERITDYGNEDVSLIIKECSQEIADWI